MATVAVTASSMFVFVGNFRQFKGTFTVQLLNICPFVMHDQMCQTVDTLTTEYPNFVSTFEC